MREALLCQQLPAPPANIPKPPEGRPEQLDPRAAVAARGGPELRRLPPAARSDRLRLRALRRASAATARLDGGEPVDASGKIIATRDMNGDFEGVTELGAKLAGSAEVEECVARQWFRFAIARFEQDMDGCSMESLLETFKAAGQDLNALPAPSWGRTPSFTAARSTRTRREMP